MGTRLKTDPTIQTYCSTMSAATAPQKNTRQQHRNLVMYRVLVCWHYTQWQRPSGPAIVIACTRRATGVVEAARPFRCLLYPSDQVTSHLPSCSMISTKPTLTKWSRRHARSGPLTLAWSIFLSNNSWIVDARKRKRNRQAYRKIFFYSSPKSVWSMLSTSLDPSKQKRREDFHTAKLSKTNSPLG
jgi:hypothetical protein